MYMLTCMYMYMCVPAPCLVNSFSDEVGREGGLKLLLVLKRIVPVSVGHAVGQRRYRIVPE